MRKAPIIALLGALFAPVSIAQMRGLSMAGTVAPSGFGRGVNVSFTGRPQSRGFSPGAIFIGDPFYADYPVAPVALPPQFVKSRRYRR
jgi:hypothetical protein